MDSKVLETDRNFVLKKFGLTKSEFETIMRKPPIDHKEYGHTTMFFEEYPYLVVFKPLWRFIQRMRSAKMIERHSPQKVMLTDFSNENYIK